MSNKLTKDQFILKCIAIHNDKYDYSATEYNGMHSMISVICRVHGAFVQKAYKHASGHGCKKCSGMYTRTKDEFIEEALKVHGTLYDYSKVELINYQKKVEIVCLQHGSFWQRPNNHVTQRQGCPTCSGNPRHDTNAFVALAAKVHGPTYDYSKTVYTGMQQNVLITCKVHGDFIQKACNHVHNKAGCMKCFRGHDIDETNFVLQASAKHKDLYDYSRSNFVNTQTKMMIICAEHGEFWQTPFNHIVNGHGCNACYLMYKSESTLHERNALFLERSKSVHENKYTYEKVVYNNNSSKVEIICPEHGSFWQTPCNHVNGAGCPACSGNKRVSKEDFLHVSNMVHGTRYGYEQVADITCRNSVVEIVCQQHGIFKQLVHVHMKGHGCPKCNVTRMSKKARQWLEFLEVSLDIQHFDNDGEYKIPNSNYFADGYCKDKNIVFEFHGDFWHGNPNRFDHNEINPMTKTTYGDLYEKTIKKKTFLLQEGYTYIECWESDWDKAIRLLRRIQKKWREAKT